MMECKASVYLSEHTGKDNREDFTAMFIKKDSFSRIVSKGEVVTEPINRWVCRFWIRPLRVARFVI